MLGRLKDDPEGRGRVEYGKVLGMNILECSVDLSGRWGKRRAGRALHRLRRRGARQVLLPTDFPWPELMHRWGLELPDPRPLLGAMAAPFALAALDRVGIDRTEACVALLGRTDGGELLRAAAQLCPLVRRLAMEEGRGTEQLRRQWGIPILPADSPADVSISFTTGKVGCAPLELHLWAGEKGLAGLELCCPELEEGEQRDLPLLAALYQGGRLERNGLKVLDKGGKVHL